MWVDLAWQLGYMQIIKSHKVPLHYIVHILGMLEENCVWNCHLSDVILEKENFLGGKTCIAE